MPIALTINSTTATTVSIDVAGHAADGTCEVQFAIRPDFKYCVSPIMGGYGRVANWGFPGLNQNTSYYGRARSVRASGVREAWSNVVMFRTPQAAPRVTAPAPIMIDPAVLVVPNPVLEWTCGQAIAGYPVANLGIDAPVAFRATPAGGAQFVFYARMAPEPIDTIALLMSNLPEAATVRVFAGPTASVAGFNIPAQPFRASANMPGRPGYHGLIRLAAPQSFEFWQVVIEASMPASLLHLEHCLFGLNRRSKNHSFDKSESGLDLGSLERTRSGNPNRVNGYRMRKVDFDLSMMNEAQYETQYADLHWKVGGTDPVFAIPNSKAGGFLHDRMLYGAISAGRVVNPATPVYTRNFTIDSLI